MRLLAVDTASGRCSAALLLDGEVRHREALTGRDHARLILPFVDELLADAGLPLGALDGIAFGRGPGSFTGLRIAAAVTQGLAAGAGLPVYPVSSLRALATQALQVAGEAGMARGGSLLACMDARMGEVYWGLFAADLRDAAEAVDAPAALLTSAAGRPVVAGAGKGLAAFPQIAVSLQLAAGCLLDDAEPHAADIARLAGADLAAGAKWLDAALAQPVYLRNQVAHMPQNAVSRPL